MSTQSGVLKQEKLEGTGSDDMASGGVSKSHHPDRYADEWSKIDLSAPETESKDEVSAKKGQDWFLDGDVEIEEIDLGPPGE